MAIERAEFLELLLAKSLLIAITHFTETVAIGIAAAAIAFRRFVFLHGGEWPNLRDHTGEATPLAASINLCLCTLSDACLAAGPQELVRTLEGQSFAKWSLTNPSQNWMFFAPVASVIVVVELVFAVCENKNGIMR